MDPVFGYQSVNVEAQSVNKSSLLHWTRRMIQIRKQHPALSLGDFQDIGGSNPSVMSYLRGYDGDAMLCVHNLSRFPQPVELDLQSFEGIKPVETFGATEFPAIGQLPYLLTLSGYGFYWFRLARDQEAPA